MNMDDPNQSLRIRETRCDSCARITPSYDTVKYGSIEGGYRHLCSQCFNKEVAEIAGLTGFENAKFEPVGLVDSAGDFHEFHFRTYLFGTGVSLDPSSFTMDTRLATPSRSSAILRETCWFCSGD